MTRVTHPVAVVAEELPERPKPHFGPFMGRLNARQKRVLGDIFGLTNFGVNLTRLPPGAISALRHAHTRQDELVYILEGEATFVFGGTMVGGKTTRPDQWLGTDITGGETHHIAKGDVFVIPAGVPHWFKEVPKSISYFVVKVIK